MRHLGLLPRSGMKELGSEVAQRPDGQVVQQFKSSHLNQPNPNPDHDRPKDRARWKKKRPVPRRSKHVLFMKKLLNMIERGNPLSAVTQITSQEFPKHVPLMKAQTSTLETKQIMIERGNPLSAVSQVTSQVTSNQCWTRWTLTSEYLDCHILLWNSELSCSWIGQEDREPPSPTFSSTRSTTEQSLQPVQYDDKANDSGRGQRFAFWTVRDGP